jgi:hypothetical protein
MTTSQRTSLFSCRWLLDTFRDSLRREKIRKGRTESNNTEGTIDRMVYSKSRVKSNWSGKAGPKWPREYSSVEWFDAIAIAFRVNKDLNEPEKLSRTSLEAQHQLKIYPQKDPILNATQRVKGTGRHLEGLWLLRRPFDGPFFCWTPCGRIGWPCIPCRICQA